MKTLNDLFFEELADIYNAEKRIAQALPKLADAARSEELKAAFELHLKETEGHVGKVEEIFRLFETEPQEAECEATAGLLEEGDELAESFEGSPALDAALICAAQKVEHYEMASYGCLHTWATLLDNTEAAELLAEILEEEKAADSALNELAKTFVNEEALT
jgi:ferritin-like metal-binding protein YciE